MNMNKENRNRVDEIEKQLNHIKETTQEKRIENYCEHLSLELEGLRNELNRFEKIEKKMEKVEVFIREECVADERQARARIGKVKELLVEHSDDDITYVETMDEPLWGWGDIKVERQGVWKGKVIDAPPLMLYGMISSRPNLGSDDDGK